MKIKIIKRLKEHNSQNCEESIIGWDFYKCRAYEKPGQPFGHIFFLSINFGIIWLSFKIYIQI